MSPITPLPDPDIGSASLAQVPPGHWAQVAALDRLPASQLERLQAYGLAPGQWVRVLQQRPVTVVEVEQLEVALEAALAQWVRVEMDGAAATAR